MSMNLLGLLFGLQTLVVFFMCSTAPRLSSLVECVSCHALVIFEVRKRKNFNNLKFGCYIINKIAYMNNFEQRLEMILLYILEK